MNTTSHNVQTEYQMRTPNQVMTLSRLGSLHQTRLSFARTLIRRMSDEKWSITISEKELNEDGIGKIVYSVDTPHGIFTFCGFTSQLMPSERTDRVIAEKWDATFTLSFGQLAKNDIKNLSLEVPMQEMGRFSSDEFILSRANKSVRLFELVVSSLAAGTQPDIDQIQQVGYLMRTTAVYGNGKFGLAGFAKVNSQKVFKLPFQAEMLSVYMTRQFTFDLAEHCAQARGGKLATKLANPIRRMLGVGNATGLGMAPFLVNHPKLLNSWITSRETALARVRAIKKPLDKEFKYVCALADRAYIHLEQWPTNDKRQSLSIFKMKKELKLVKEQLITDAFLAKFQPWDQLINWAESQLSVETQELLISILIEPYGKLVDDLENENVTDEAEETLPRMKLGELRRLLKLYYNWALNIDFSKSDNNKYYWYRSEEKQEPRLGERHTAGESGTEMPLTIARDVTCLFKKLDEYKDKMSVAEFLIIKPEFRRIVRRVQTVSGLPYAEIRNNLIGSDCEPIDLLRCKLSFFGATKFDPKSKLWTRINLFQGAPLPSELGAPNADDWFSPIFS